MCNKNHKNNYELYLREKHRTIGNNNLIVKQGCISKEALVSEFENNALTTYHEKLLESIFGIYKFVYDVVKNDISKIYSLIDSAKEDVDFLEIQNNNGLELNIVQDDIKLISENMCYDFLYLINRISQNTYKTVYESLIEILPENAETYEIINDEHLEISEIYDKINIWLENFKSWLLDNISTSFENSIFEIKSYFQKGLFIDIFENINNTFEKSKDKIEYIIKNTILNTWTMAEKIAFKVQRVGFYQIVLSGHPNACERCKEMAGEHFNIADLKIGQTAPPFHPNCGCTMIPYIWAEKEGSLWEQVVIAANVAFEFLAQIGPTEKIFPPFYDFVKSAIFVAGSSYLKNRNLPLSQEMFRLGMYGKGQGLSIKARELMIECLKKSEILKEKIREYTSNGKNNFNSGKTGAHFTPQEPDLHYCVQKVDLWLEGNKLEDDKWEIKVRLEDKYDFTEFRNSLAFTDLANNLGESMQRNVMMTEFTTEVEFTHIFEGL